MKKEFLTELPEKGTDLYLPSSEPHGYNMEREFQGGLCKIQAIKPIMIPVKNSRTKYRVKFLVKFEGIMPSSEYNLEYLLSHQEEWGEKYGDRRGRNNSYVGRW